MTSTVITWICTIQIIHLKLHLTHSHTGPSYGLGDLTAQLIMILVIPTITASDASEFAQLFVNAK